MMTQRPISCDEVIEQLFDYLDNELHGDTSAAIDHHLQHCRDCFSRAEFEKKLRARIAEAGRAEAGRARASDRLRRRIEGLIERF